MKKEQSFSEAMFYCALCLCIIAALSGVEYFLNIANAVGIPIFALSIIDLCGKVKNHALREIDLESKIAITELKWHTPYYNLSKGHDDEESQKIQIEHAKLIDYINCLDKIRNKVNKWFKWYTPIDILLLTITFILAVTANMEIVLVFSSKINFMYITLFSFLLFVFDTLYGERIAGKLVKYAKEKI